MKLIEILFAGPFRRAKGYYAVSWKDLDEGLRNWRLWYRMSVLDIRRRYRRTILGPFWTSFSMALFIMGLGLVFSKLWKLDINEYIPFLTSGFIVWFPISAMILEGATVFVSSFGVVSVMPLPYSIFILNLVFRNFLVMGHHMVVYVLVAIFLTVDLNGVQLLAIPAAALVMINGVWVAIVVGIICARYRDLTPLFGNILQILVFMSPIFWPPAQLGERGVGIILVKMNLFYHFVELMRAPLLGKVPSTLTYLVVLGTTIVGWTFTLWFFGRYRHRIVYWL
jgi:ABC-type polysaccharide/polyol phosphate export permease